MNKKTLSITICIVLVLIIIVSSILFVIRNNNSSYNGVIDHGGLVSSPSSSPISFSEEVTTKSFSFESFPLVFDYSLNITLSTQGSGQTQIAELKFGNNFMKIVPNQKGLGVEEPAPEITESKIIINGKSITKNKLYYAKTNTTTFLIIIPYKDSQSRGYSVMATYSFANGLENPNSIKVFDEVLKTFQLF